MPPVRPAAPAELQILRPQRKVTVEPPGRPVQQTKNALLRRPRMLFRCALQAFAEDALPGERRQVLLVGEVAGVGLRGCFAGVEDVFVGGALGVYGGDLGLVIVALPLDA